MMSKSKRSAIISGVVIVLALSIILTGCSRSESSSEKDGVTTVTFWYSGSDALKKDVEAFNKKHKKVHVKAAYAKTNSTSDDKLLTATAGGNPPDVAFFARHKVGSWVEQKALTDISDYAKKDGITKDDFYSFAWEEASSDGKLYAIPLSTDSRLLYYNKDHFKEVGLDPNKPPKTIKELENAAEKLTKKKGNRFERIGFIPWYDEGQLITWGLNFGGRLYDEKTGKVTPTDPKVVKALQWERDWAKKYNVESITGFTNSAGGDAQDPFITGQLSMTVSGPLTATQIRKYKPDLNYGVAPIPTPDGKNSTTWSGGWSVVIPKGAKHPEAAREFLKFMADPEAQEQMTSLVYHLCQKQKIGTLFISHDLDLVAKYAQRVLHLTRDHYTIGEIAEVLNDSTLKGFDPDQTSEMKKQDTGSIYEDEIESSVSQPVP